MENLEKSELVIAKILNLLTEFGLQPAELKFEELELDASFRPFFLTCAQWLSDEDIIRCGEIVKFIDGKGFLHNPVITSYGFALLNKDFPGQRDRKKLSTAVKELAKGERSYSQIGDLLGGILGGFTKSLGS